MRRFIREMFEDDTGSICVGRVSLILGILVTAFTATIYMNTDGEVSWGEAVVRCCPAIAGLLAYIFTRLAESKEWISETVQRVTNATKKDIRD